MSSREEQMPSVVGGEKNKAAHLSYILLMCSPIFVVKEREGSKRNSFR